MENVGRFWWQTFYPVREAHRGVDFREPGVAGLFAGFEGGGAPAVEFACGTVAREVNFAVSGEEGLNGGRAEFGGLADDFDKGVAFRQTDGEDAGRRRGVAGNLSEAHLGGAGVGGGKSSSSHPTPAIEEFHGFTEAGAADPNEVGGFVGWEDEFAALGGPGTGMEHAEHEEVCICQDRCRLQVTGCRFSPQRTQNFPN